MHGGSNSSLKDRQQSEGHHGQHKGGQDPGATLLFNLELEKYEGYIIFVGFLTIIALLLMLFNETFLHKVARKVPESVMLILLGIGFAAVGSQTSLFKVVAGRITAATFFNFLLPPIILNSAYQLYCKPFLYNLDGVMLMAIFGTALNIFSIGLSIWGTWGIFKGKNLLKCLLYSAIISAVDPVAVLAVFNQIGVQRSLYFLIFGESLFNDGVTVVVFDTLEKIAFVDEIAGSTYAYAVLSFFPVALGGAIIGIVYGLVSSLACKYTHAESKILEPTLILLSAYMAFLNAQLFHWSGIMALIGCGLTQKRYGFQNTFEKSRVTIEIGVGILATIAETIIFLILGFKVLDGDIRWDVWLILVSLLFCLLYRYLYTYIIGYAINSYRLHKLSFNHMFMISYGGLRGAVSFAMAASLHEEEVKDVFMGATLAVILGTVMVQGTTIKFLVDLMHFKEQSHSDNFTSTSIQKINFHVLAGMETILGGGGSTIHCWMEKIERFDKKYIHPIMCNKGSDEKRFATMLKNQSKGNSLQNHVLWGAQDYAKKKIAAAKDSEDINKPPSPKTKRQKSKEVSKFKEAIRDKKEDSRDTVFATDEKLNQAWRRKLDLIRAMKQAAAHESQSDGDINNVMSRPPVSSPKRILPKRKPLHNVRLSTDDEGTMNAHGPYPDESQSQSMMKFNDEVNPYHVNKHH